MPPGGGCLGLETPPWCPPCPHAKGNQCGRLARTEFAFRPTRRPFWDAALPGAAAALGRAGLGQAVAPGQGFGLRGGLAHCAGPAPPHLRPGVPALVRGLGPPVPRRQVGDRGRDRGQIGGPGGPDGQRGSPYGPCGGPQCRRAPPGGHEGSAGRRSEREF